MKTKKPQFTKYALGVIAILEGGGHLDCEKAEDGFWECLLYDCDSQYLGMVPRVTVARLLQTGKTKLEADCNGLQIYVATSLINPEPEDS